MNKNITPRNEKGKPHGYCEMYWSDGRLSFKCFYINDKEVGYEEEYHYFTNPHVNIIFHL